MPASLSGPSTPAQFQNSLAPQNPNQGSSQIPNFPVPPFYTNSQMQSHSFGNFYHPIYSS